MPTNRDIRGRYTEIIGYLAKEHGAAASGYEISKDANLVQCIGYARRFIVGRANDEPHYRYDRYMRVLNSALRRDPVNTGTVVHVDIGCGPGLFTWVVRDYFRARPQIEVDLYGYDHSKEMIRLADYIWDRLEEDVDYMCFHKTKDLLTQIPQIITAPFCMLITLGHVLVQTVDDDSALSNFARIIAKCAPMTNCLVVAVDAQTGNRPDQFRRACDKLEAALTRRGLTVGIPAMGRSDMVTSVYAMGQA